MGNAYLVKAFSLLGAEVLFSYNKNKNDSLDIIRSIKKNIRFCKINIFPKNNISPIEKKSRLCFLHHFGKIYDKNKSLDQNKLNLFYDFYIKGFLNIYNLC